MYEETRIYIHVLVYQKFLCHVSLRNESEPQTIEPKLRVGLVTISWLRSLVNELRRRNRRHRDFNLTTTNGGSRRHSQLRRTRHQSKTRPHTVDLYVLNIMEIYTLEVLGRNE